MQDAGQAPGEGKWEMGNGKWAQHEGEDLRSLSFFPISHFPFPISQSSNSSLDTDPFHRHHLSPGATARNNANRPTRDAQGLGQERDQGGVGGAVDGRGGDSQLHGITVDSGYLGPGGPGLDVER
jgi:hypothetical protein